MFVRSHCGSDAPSGELACNDDAVEGDLNFRSRVRFNVSANETAYVFLKDSASGLTVRTQSRVVRKKDAYAFISDNPQLTTLLAAIDGSGLRELLSDDRESLTVWPQMMCFAILRDAVSIDVFNALLADAGALESVFKPTCNSWSLPKEQKSRPWRP